MLFNITADIDNSDFEFLIEQVKNLYWPEKIYHWKEEEDATQSKIKAMFPAWKGETDDNKIARLNEVRDKITDYICNEKRLYPLYKRNDARKKRNDARKIDRNEVKYCYFPFIDRFHTYFLKRKWNKPFADLRGKTDYNDFFRLIKNKIDEAANLNYSANVDNYYHFTNVVACLARLIRYFNNQNNHEDIFKRLDFKADNVVYSNEPDKRTLNLMLAGFFHDLGKTIEDSRHGMEGAIIMAYHTSLSLFYLHQIVAEYVKNYNFEKNDILFISDLLYYHDQYGIMGTGEAGYLYLNMILKSVKQHSNNKEDGYLEATLKKLFDLWLLNIADIIVSYREEYNIGEEGKKDMIKYIDQTNWWCKHETANKIIEQFFKKEIAHGLLKDLNITYKIMMRQADKKEMEDNVDKMQAKAFYYSQNYTLDRLHRLVSASMRSAYKRDKNEKGEDKECPEFIELIEAIENLDDSDHQIAIVQAIHSVGDYDDFCRRFSWISKMDYSLGFFKRIAKRILSKLNEELKAPKDYKKRTSWLIYQKDNDENCIKQDSKYYYKMQARQVICNYASIIIQIIGYILFRESQINQMRNIEFNDAQRRLTEEKIDKIIALEGPFWSKRSTQLILQSIYIY